MKRKRITINYLTKIIMKYKREKEDKIRIKNEELRQQAEADRKERR